MKYNFVLVSSRGRNRVFENGPKGNLNLFTCVLETNEWISPTIQR